MLYHLLVIRVHSFRLIPFCSLMTSTRTPTFPQYVIEEEWFPSTSASIASAERASGGGWLGKILIAMLMSVNPFSPINWILYVICLLITRYALYSAMWSGLYKGDYQHTATLTLWKRSAYLALILYFPLAIPMNIVAGYIMKTLIGSYVNKTQMFV